MKKYLIAGLICVLVSAACKEDEDGFVYGSNLAPTELPSIEELAAMGESDSSTEERNAYKTRVAKQLFADGEYMNKCASLSTPEDGPFILYIQIEKDGVLSVFGAKPETKVTRCIGREVLGRKVEAPKEPYVFDLNMQFK